MAKKKQEKVTEFLDYDKNGNIVTKKLTGNTGGYDAKDLVKSKKTTSVKTPATVERTIKPTGSFNKKQEFTNNDTTDIRTVDTVNKKEKVVSEKDTEKKDNKKQTQKEFDKADKELKLAKNEYALALGPYRQALSNELQKQGIDYSKTINFDDYSKKKLDFKSKEEGIKPQAPKSQKAIGEVIDVLPDDVKNNLKEANRKEAFAQYNYDVAKVNNEDSTLLQKTLGVPYYAIADLLSPITDDNIGLTDEKGNKIFLPSYNELKYQKVHEDTSGVGKFLQDIGYNSTKIIGAGLLDIPTAGVGGKALYWTDMATDNFENAKNEGYDNKSAIANTIISTGTEFLTEKLLGGLSKKLTGGKASQLQKGISNKIYKIIQEPKIANVIGSMGSEGAEEFLQEWIGAVNDAVTLGKDIDIWETFKNSLYSAAVGAGSGGVVTGTNNVEGIEAQRGIDEANGLIDILNQRKAQTTDKRALNDINKALDQAQNYVESPFSTKYENTNQELNKAIGKIDRRLTKVQNLNEVERDALTEITQKRLSGEPLNDNDIATINYLNSKEVTQEDIANQQVQEIQRNAEEGKISKGEAAQEIQAIDNVITNQNEEIQETPQEIEQAEIEETPVEENKQEVVEEKPVVKEQPKKQENKRIVNGRNYGAERYSKLSDEDIKSLDAIYTKQKNNEALNENDRKQLDYFKRKSKGLKNPELTTNNTYEETRKELSKTSLNKYDDTLMKQAKEVVEANKQGRRTKQQWLELAKYMGMQMQDADSNSIKEYALQTFKSERPNQKENLNRQSAGYVDFKVNEWVNAFYEGAGVGEKTNTQQEKIDSNIETKYNDDVVKEKPIRSLVEAAYEKVKENNDEGTSDSSFSNENIPAKKEEDVIRVKTKEQEREHLEKNGVSKEAAKILSEMPKPDDLTIKEKIKEGKASVAEEWQYFKRNLVDKGETIYTIAKKTKNRLLYAKYDKRGTTVGEANYDIGKAQTDLNGKEFKNFKVKDENGKIKNVAMSLNDIWDGIDVAAANEYLANWLNVDRYPQMNETGRRLQASLQERIDKGQLTQKEADEIIRKHEGNKYVLSPDITDKDSLKRIKELEKEHPELKLFGENIWQYGKNQLQMRVESGEISKAQAQQFEKETPHYVRLQREVPQQSTNKIEFDKNGNAKVNRQIKEFKGSNYNILPFKEVMAQNTLDVRNSVRDNMFAQELAKTLGVSADGGKITDINDIMGINEDLVAKRGVEDNGDGTYSFTFYNDGGLVTIPINEGIYEALQPNKTYDLENKRPLKLFRKVDSVRKALLTDKNPLFLATNMMKDLFDAPLNSRYPLLFGKNYLKAVKEIILQGGKGKNYQQYQALGGLQNTYFENQSFQKQGSMKNPLNWITKANNAIEQLPRLAEFMSTMEKTGNIDEAMYNAAEITTNFKRGGNVSKALNRNGATFLNASIQGFSKQVRNFTDAFNIQDGKVNVDARLATQMLAKAVILGIAPAVLNDWAYDDDDDYQDLQDYIKDNYYLFKGRDGTWVRIPKGRAVSVFQSAARRTKYRIKGDEKAYKGFMRQASNQIAPNNPLENNILSPFIDVAANKSWSGNPIVSEYKHNETHQGEVEQDMKTDKLSKWLGKTFNYSPKKINYIIDQYSGVLGDVILPLGTDYAESKSDNPLYQAFVNPLISKFTTNSVTSSKSQQEFYDALSKANDDNDKSWSGRTETHQAVASYLGSKSKEISDIRKKITELQESDKSNREKFEGSLEYTKQINAIAKDAVKQSKKIKKSGNSIKVGDSEFTIANGEATKINQKTVDAAKEFGISAAAYRDISTYKYNARADKDENGKTIRGTAKQKVIDYVYSKEELTEAQKKAIIEKLYSRK